MKNQLSRRAVFVGAAALPVLALPAVSAIASQVSEAGLAALIAELKALEQHIKLEGSAIDKMETDIRATLPPVPPELLQVIELAPLNQGQALTMASSTSKPNNEIVGWSQEELQGMLKRGTYEFAARFDTAHVKDLLDCDMAIACKSVKMSPATKANIARLLDLRRAHDAIEEAALAEHQQRQEAWEGHLQQEDELLTEIIEWPVQSMAELALKARALSENANFKGSFTYELQCEACKMMFADIARLAVAA